MGNLSKTVDFLKLHVFLELTASSEPVEGSLCHLVKNRQEVCLELVQCLLGVSSLRGEK